MLDAYGIPYRAQNAVSSEIYATPQFCSDNYESRSVGCRARISVENSSPDSVGIVVVGTQKDFVAELIDQNEEI